MNSTELNLLAEQLLRVEREWRLTFDAIVHPIMILDGRHRIIRANKAMAERLGRAPDELTGLSCYREVHGIDGPPAFCPHAKLLQDGRSHESEIYDERLGGFYAITVSPLVDENGRVYGSVHYAADVTARKRAEDEVRTLNQELEQRVVERTRELLEAREELIRGERLATLGQLAGSVGHELRNPLGVINNAVFYLKTVLSGAGDTVGEYLDIIKSEVDTSQRIISDLLDFSRTRAPRMQPTALGPIIDRSIGACVLGEGVAVMKDVPKSIPPVRADPLHLEQVFQNLIANAVQAMPEGGTLRVRARRVRGAPCGAHSGEANNAERRTPDAELRGDLVEISVSDTGIGIAPENKEKIFQPLFTTKAKGIGLGLALAKRHIEANHGTITAASEPGKGTVFTVRLPVAA